MTAQILVVDDIAANVRLLEAKLSNEYYDVITASDGMTAFEMAKQYKPDLILLDVMMPGIDGFETCRMLKEDTSISHIPVVMVTALSDTSDKVSGLEAGADDFITKPINDTALFARVKSLIRIKVLMDELRMRDKTGAQMGISEAGKTFTSDVSGSHIVVIDDDVVQSKNIETQLDGVYQITHMNDPEQGVEFIKSTDQEIDLIIVSTQMMDCDGLRIAMQIKSIETARRIPIIMLIDEDDTNLMLKGLELGINDYLIIPADANEMKARIRTQIRRKKYQAALRDNYKTSLSLAVKDQLTGLYNRHYLDAHIENTVHQSLENRKPMSVLMMDMDHFKLVNDDYGHPSGDEVLRQLANIITGIIRSSDLATRFGGEEFVILLPETNFISAYELADRIRRRVAAHIFQIPHEIGTIQKTLSVGVASIMSLEDTASEMLDRADKALYAAKNAGRNKVFPVPKHLAGQQQNQYKAETPAPVNNANANNMSGMSTTQNQVSSVAPAPVAAKIDTGF